MPNATLSDVLGSSVRAEWDTTVASSLWSNAAKTVQAGDGDLVPAWESTSLGNPHDFVHATAHPTYRTNANGSGFPGLEFSGAQTLGVNHADFQITDCFMLAVATYNGAPASAATILHRGSGGQFQRIDHTGSNIRLQSIGEPVAIADVLMPRDTSRFCVVASSRNDGTTGSHRLSSVAAAAATGDGDGPAGNGDLWVGSRTGIMQYFVGWIHHIIIVDGNCNRGDVENAARILRDKWSIPDPDPMPQVSSGSGSSGFPLSRVLN